MRGLGYLNRNTDPSGNEAEDALDTLNEMLAGWDREHMMLPYVLIQPVTLVANQSLYTVGVGGDINITADTILLRLSRRITLARTVSPPKSINTLCGRRVLPMRAWMMAMVFTATYC